MSARLSSKWAARAILFALLIAPGAALAQESGPADSPGKASTRAEITAGTKDKSASITLVLAGEGGTGPVDSEGRQKWQYNQLSLSVSTPFDGDSDAMPASLDGLADGTKFSVRFGSFRGATRFALTEQQKQIVDRAIAACLSKVGEENRVARSDETLEDFNKRRETALEACRHPNGTSNWVYTYLPKEYGSYQDPDSAMLDWGLEGSIGYREFNYVDAGTLAKQNTSKVQVSGKVFFAYYPSARAVSVIGSVGYEHGYTAKDKVILCPAASGSTPVTCTMASPGAPELDEGLLVSLGLRQRFFGADDTPLGLAIAPLVTYDALDDIFGVDVPLYFFSDGKTGLSGGLRAGWRSDDKKFRFGVFIGSNFDVFK